MAPHIALLGASLMGLAAAMTTASATPVDDARIVADLDTRYQAAVKINDAATMDKILHQNMVLLTGNGAIYTKDDLLKAARTKASTYEQQDEEPGSQVVRVFGDTAVVTAKLWLKGKTGDKAFDRKLWFSDTYVRTPEGWQYAFGQASLALPP
jgi:ketosteroid isomerase-like protein